MLFFCIPFQLCKNCDSNIALQMMWSYDNSTINKHFVKVCGIRCDLNSLYFGSWRDKSSDNIIINCGSSMSGKSNDFFIPFNEIEHLPPFCQGTTEFTSAWGGQKWYFRPEPRSGEGENIFIFATRKLTWMRLGQEKTDVNVILIILPNFFRLKRISLFQPEGQEYKNSCPAG